MRLFLLAANLVVAVTVTGNLLSRLETCTAIAVGLHTFDNYAHQYTRRTHIVEAERRAAGRVFHHYLFNKLNRPVIAC